VLISKRDSVHELKEKEGLSVIGINGYIGKISGSSPKVIQKRKMH
jgi:hypothetical protein